MEMKQDIHLRSLVINMKINYDVLMEEEIKNLDGKKTLLLHSCCGPCSTTCIERLNKYFDVTVIYYNPNIEPFDEYLKRKQEQMKVLKKFNINFIESDYDNDNFRNLTCELKDEPEGGKRCPVCFKMRLEKTAKVAKENNFDYFTTTLTVSPHKDSQIINKIGEAVGEKYGVKYLYTDFKKKEGYKRSIELSKELDLYRQNYCGCLYGKEKGE